MNLTFHHVGVGTTKFHDAVRVYETLGYALTVSVDDHGLGVKVAFLANREAGSPLIEILAPLNSKSPLHSWISRGLLPSPYHTCYAVHDINAARSTFKRCGFLAISRAKPAAAFGGSLVAFFYSRAVGMVEAVENPRPFQY